MSARVACMAVVVGSLAAHGSDWRAQGRLWLGTGFDSNVRRDYTSRSVSTQPDLFLFGLGHAQVLGRLAERLHVLGAYDVAARKFFFWPSQDTLVQDAQLEANVQLARLLAVGVQGRARDRRGADRDYSDLVGGALVEFFPDAALDVRLTVGAHRFLYWNRFAYSYFGPEGGLSVSFRLNRRHSLSANGAFTARTYNANATPPPGMDGDPPPPVVTRRDSVVSAGAGYAYRGPFHVGLGYSYFDQSSNSYGETQRRHRFTLTGGVQLPWKVTALASVTAQLSSFPDGVYLSPDLTVVEDDESASSVTLKLVRPLSSLLDLDVRYAGYLNVLPQNQFLYVRHVVSVGLSLNL